jgi:hypothetical protein
MKRYLIPLASLTVLVVTSPRVLAQTCPTNALSYGGNSGYYELFSTDAITSWGFASYNLVAGTLAASVTGSGEVGSFANLGIQDRYRIVGPGSGTPLSITVRVSFTGGAGGGEVELPYIGLSCLGSTVQLRLSSDATQDDAIVYSNPTPACGGQSVNELLEIVLQKFPGEEFPVSVGVDLSAGHTISSHAAGTLVFSGLPPGYGIQSCQGFSGTVVWARATSWARLKQIYR